MAGDDRINDVHGPGIDEPLVMRKNGNDYFYAADGLGSVRTITDSNKNIVNSYNYDSFGNPKNWNEQVDGNPYTYTAREYNSESGDYYYRARTYHQGIGRFIQEDPIWVKSQFSNLYVYCLNNPMVLVDPTGKVVKIGIRGSRLGGKKWPAPHFYLDVNGDTYSFVPSFSGYGGDVVNNDPVDRDSTNQWFKLTIFSDNRLKFRKNPASK